MSKRNKDGWIEWNSRVECPVDRGVIVFVKYRDGLEAGPFPALVNTAHQRDAGAAFWNYDGACNDIVSYRVLDQPEHKQDQPNIK